MTSRDVSGNPERISTNSEDSSRGIDPNRGARRPRYSPPAVGARRALFVVPPVVTSVNVMLVGGNGGAGAHGTNGGAGATGGARATEVATIAATPGEKLYTEVGGDGGAGDMTGLGNGGYNGGGDDDEIRQAGQAMGGAEAHARGPGQGRRRDTWLQPQGPQRRALPPHGRRDERGRRTIAPAAGDVLGQPLRTRPSRRSSAVASTSRTAPSSKRSTSAARNPSITSRLATSSSSPCERR